MDIRKQRVLYIIMGTSGSGKTTLLQHMVYSTMSCKAAHKYSNREQRPDETGEDGTKMHDDILHLQLQELEKKCDVLYEINNNKYGVDSADIIETLNQESGDDVALILSDVRAIKFLKRKVEDAGHIVKVLYLLSRMDSPSEFVKIWQKRVEGAFVQLGDPAKAEWLAAGAKINKELDDFLSLNNKDELFLVDIQRVNKLCDTVIKLLPQSDSSRKRSEKIRLMFTQYVHNISLFDYVILNTTTKKDMFRQIEKIVDWNRRYNHQLLAKQKMLIGPVIFVLCASPKSGKGTLMENLNIMGVSQIQITPKYANRLPEKNDKRDGMIALGMSGFENQFGTLSDDKSDGNVWRWAFHKTEKDMGTEYAIKIKDILECFNKGVCQIFVSNFEQLERIYKDEHLQKVLGDLKARLVFIYLHRVRAFDELFAQAVDEDCREEIASVHKSYIENMEKIDHVIINPDYLTYSEDLHDQMMSLIELYRHNGGAN
jgi:guanylate kinase